MGTQTESYNFKSEAQQLLDLMIHSLYSNKEIFLRELVSNASDALDKLRFEALTDKSLRDDDTALRVRISTDAEARTLSVDDNGIGMSREDAIEHLGTIARSGTKEFAARLADAEGTEADPESLIGQFGVGFYSTFMAASEVTVTTRRAGEESATLWRSTGDGTFEVGDAERETAGTTVTLKLRDADPDNGLPDFTEEWTVKGTIKRYSDFVTYPIELRTERTEPKVDEEGEEIEGAEPETIVEWTTVNSMKAIWTRSASDVTDEEYAEFYKHIAHDWEPPFERISFSGEGAFTYSALLFIPDRAPFDLFYRDQKYGLQLYVNRVLIQERCEDLLPEWLRFVRGVVDSPDLSLNVSREILQNDRRVGAIRKRVVKKVVDTLAKVQKDDRERYASFWEKYGRVLKEGTADTTFGEKIHPLLWFQSSADDTALTSLAEYVERMKDGQEAIYFVTGESRAAVSRSPHIEAFAAKGYEVLYLTDPIDEIMVGHLGEFDGKPLRSVGKGEVELGTDEEKKEAEEARAEKQIEHEALLGAVQTALDEHVKEVRLSSRLTESAVCLVGEEHDMSPQLQRLLKQHNQDAPDVKRILEINPDHPVLATLQAVYDDDPDSVRVGEYAKLLHGQALLTEGSPVPDPVEFSRLVADLMVRG